MTASHPGPHSAFVGGVGLFRWSSNKLEGQTHPEGIHIAPCSLNVTRGPRLIC